MWATKLGRDLYRLENNGFYARVSIEDVVRVRIRWPYREVVEIVERSRRVVRVSFDLPWPSKRERRVLGENLRSLGCEIEWGEPFLVTISCPRDQDPYELLDGVLGENSRILEVDA
ncbi:DUF4265 domain-containing protein [Nocardia puris]|uniref:DUF4265 domain-containing protein n=1 Tax=Nocardia puris TaxID=208602 RepID=UPI0034DD7FEA